MEGIPGPQLSPLDGLGQVVLPLDVFDFLLEQFLGGKEVFFARARNGLPGGSLTPYPCFMVTETPRTSKTAEPGPAWHKAEAYGCDMDLLAESLALTPAERLRLHTIALRRVEQLP